MPISGVVLMTHEYNNYRKSQKPVVKAAPELKAPNTQTAGEYKNAPEPKRDPVREVLAIMMPF